LAKHEAEYLAERVRLNAGSSLLNQLISECSCDAEIDAPWEHPELASLSQRHRQELEHARRFSEIMHGAPLLYNLIVSELCAREEEVAGYRERLGDWSANMTDHLSEFRGWSLTDFWIMASSVNSRIPLPARLFVERWIELVLRVGPERIPDSDAARRLVADRERAIKRGLARVDNVRAREVWRGESGVRRIEYRWNSIVKQLIVDIQEGVQS
jgi:hypothetical protein